MLITSLVVVHVILVTAGYVGLIATNAWLLVLCRNTDAQTALRAVKTWRNMARTFGPILGVGVLAGIALAISMGIPLTALWLVVTYVLVVLALGTQAAIMVPWQLRAESIIAREESVATRPLVTVIVALTVAYIAIASMMLMRPV